ncbi:MAG: S9 family peptidase, partial [Cyclobacteriaceae bacterium]|nr:S9 family peptidase [Cyclobacteriaceae bacterium]
MRNLTSLLLLLAGFVTYAQFSLEDILKYPFPADLVAAQTVNRIAWTVNERGKRNVYVAEGPAYAARKLTSYEQDDGQEISSLSLSADGKRIVYVRGGEHGSNWDDDVTLNPLSMPFPEK